MPEMWVMARAEGWVSSLEEFGEMTLAQFDGFMRHRTAKHKYQCYYAGIVASAVANYAGRHLPDGVLVSPMDYVPRSVDTQLLEQRKRNLQNFVGMMMWLSPHASPARLREKAIASLLEGGCTELEAVKILREMFPAWERVKNA